jgi:hypothetical protein
MEAKYLDRFMARIDDQLQWTGVGTTCLVPERREVWVVAWELFVGPFDDERMTILPCPERATCCDPHHLTAVWIDAPDEWAPPKVTSTNKPGGHPQKLTDAQVYEILCDDRKFREIAATYGVTVSTIKGIRQRKIRRWVLPPAGYELKPKGHPVGYWRDHPPDPDKSPLCSVPTCGARVAKRGWCGAHYMRWREHGDIQADVPVRGRLSR